jgi:hypothetical protein
MNIFNNIIDYNIDYNYIKNKNNIMTILFQLWYTPLFCLSLINGSYYENNNDMVFIEYIRNYEILNLIHEFFYMNPYCIRSVNIFHHVIGIVAPTIFLIYNNDNLPLINDMKSVTTITMTTTFLLNAIKILHKNIPLKILFFLQYFYIRILRPLPLLYQCSTGVYLQNVLPRHYLMITLSYLMIYLGYGLNIFWFYKIIRILKKIIVVNFFKNKQETEPVHNLIPQQPQIPPPCEQAHITPNTFNTSKFVYVPCGH